MKLIILDPSREEFERLCEEFDVEPALETQIPIQVIPGVTMQMNMHVIPDDSKLATWIMLHHPDWATAAWQQINNILYKDREAPAHGQH